MVRRLMLVHGRSFKPREDALQALWFEAVEHGLYRDGHTLALKEYRNVAKTFVYYGDISNAFLRKNGRSYNEERDLEDRRRCLDQLRGYAREQFLGEKGRRIYHALPGASAWKQRCARVLEPLDIIRATGPLIRWRAIDVAHYWNPDTQFGSSVRWQLTVPLRQALWAGDDLCLVAHSLGTMIAYDVLWKLSYYGEYAALRDRKAALNMFVTLGSPLGNRTVRRHLKGGRALGARRYPTVIRAWKNFAATDDYISHDMTLADDYGAFTIPVHDFHLYNIAVRHRKAHPHHGAGYLTHPLFIEALAEWLVPSRPGPHDP